MSVEIPVTRFYVYRSKWYWPIYQSSEETLRLLIDTTPAGGSHGQYTVKYIGYAPMLMISDGFFLGTHAPPYITRLDPTCPTLWLTWNRVTNLSTVGDAWDDQWCLKSWGPILRLRNRGDSKFDIDSNMESRRGCSVYSIQREPTYMHWCTLYQYPWNRIHSPRVCIVRASLYESLISLSQWFYDLEHFKTTTLETYSMIGIPDTKHIS